MSILSSGFSIQHVRINRLGKLPIPGTLSMRIILKVFQVKEAMDGNDRFLVSIPYDIRFPEAGLVIFPVVSVQGALAGRCPGAV